MPAWIMRVRAGSTLTFFLNWMGSTSGVKEATAHPKYSSETMDFDVGVLVLKKALKAGPGINPIALPGQGEHVASGDVGLVSGWGTLYVSPLPSG